MGRILLFFYCILSFSWLNAQTTIRVLFDASKAEMAGNADWVIDANTHNIGFSSGPAVVGQGTESNPAITPSPAQSGVTATTPETFWNGALSAWAVDCAKRGYQVESLPYNGVISYGNASNAQDLSNYKVFIVCEPNIVFTAAEKTAMLNFVLNGGGLFMVSDHDVSDRNNDNWDSPGIWNDFMSNNSIATDPFGFSIDLQNFSQTSFNVATLPGDSILNGPMGPVAEAMWTNGTSFTLIPADNASTTGVIYKTSSSTTGTTNVMALYGRYGAGKFAAIGDSSPCDDGTGDSNDVLYNGYFADAAGNHQLLIMNMTIWLAETNAVTTDISSVKSAQSISVFPNPSNGVFDLVGNVDASTPIFIYDFMGNEVKNEIANSIPMKIDLSNENAGIYFVVVGVGVKRSVVKVVKMN